MIVVFDIFLGWILIGLLTAPITCGPPKTSKLNDDGYLDFDDYNYYRFIFCIILWPIALLIRIVRFIVHLLAALYIGFKEEIKCN